MPHWSWAIPTNSGASDAAWAFASWITAKQHDVERTEKGGAAIRQSTLQNPAVLGGTYGADYYQNMVLWGLPAAMAAENLAGPTKEGKLVQRILKAAAAK